MSGYTTPAYDADGNMTTDQSGLKYVYNAWGEEVTVKNSTDSTLESYTYDGLGNQMSNTVGSTTTDYYNSTASSGQVLEELSGGIYTTRYVWSPAYVNQMIGRDTDTSGTGLTATGTCYTRLFPLQDANCDTVALANTSSSVVERYAYDPFGSVTYMKGSYGARSVSIYQWVYGLQGGRLDVITGDIEFGAKNEDPATGTWTSGAWVLSAEEPMLADSPQNSDPNFVGPPTPYELTPEFVGPPAPPSISSVIREESAKVVQQVRDLPSAQVNTPTGTIPITSRPGSLSWQGEKGPCFHYVNLMVKKLLGLRKNNPNINFEVMKFRPRPGTNQPFLTHIIIKIIITDPKTGKVIETILLDAGGDDRARGAGNMGGADGVIRQEDYDEFLKRTIKVTKIDPRG